MAVQMKMVPPGGRTRQTLSTDETPTHMCSFVCVLRHRAWGHITFYTSPAICTWHAHPASFLCEGHSSRPARPFWQTATSSIITEAARYQQRRLDASTSNFMQPVTPSARKRFFQFLTSPLSLYSRLHADLKWELPGLFTPRRAPLTSSSVRQCTRRRTSVLHNLSKKRFMKPLKPSSTFPGGTRLLNYHASKRRSNIPLPEISAAAAPTSQPGRCSHTAPDHHTLAPLPTECSLDRGDQNDSFPSDPSRCRSCEPREGQV